jgi:hypothetical protein
MAWADHPALKQPPFARTREQSFSPAPRQADRARANQLTMDELEASGGYGGSDTNIYNDIWR